MTQTIEDFQLNTKEFGWNGTEGHVRNGGLYALLLEKPNFSFQYSSGVLSTDPNAPTTFIDLNGNIINLTDAQHAEVIAFIEAHAVEDHWDVKVSDPRLLLEQVNSLSEIEVYFRDTWMPFLDFLESYNPTETQIAFYLMKSRTIEMKNHAYELFTHETMDNDLKGFLPTIKFENPSMGTVHKWLFKLKKTNDTHVEFEITDALNTVHGVGIMNSLNPDFYGFKFTGDIVVSNENCVESYNERYRAFTFVDSKGAVVHRFSNTRTNESKDFIVYDELGKLHLPAEAYLDGKKVLTESDSTQVLEAAIFMGEQEVFIEELHIGGN